MSDPSPDHKAPRAQRVPGSLLAAAIAVGLTWLPAFMAAPAPIVPGSGPALGGPAYRASGIVHVHTNLSDGYGTPAEVVRAAASAKADFVLITDHNHLDPAAFDVLLRRPGDPVVMLGAEVSTEAGHVLAIAIREPAFRFSGTLREVLDDIHHLGGCAFVAHPMSPRGETRFSREGEAGAFGVEVVNGDSAWREASPFSLALAAWTYPVNSAYALRQTLGSFAAERKFWDRTLSRRFAPGVGGTDAHGRIPISRTIRIPLPSYESLFGLVRTVVHLKEPLPAVTFAARAVLNRALCAGESVIAIPSLADPSGFAFVAHDQEGKVWGPGATLPFVPGLSVRLGGAVPAGTTLRLIESGHEVASGMDELNVAISREGVYRAEAYVPGVATPWVLSNPISILSPATELTRMYAAQPVVEPYVVGATEIDRFEDTTSFAPEHDPGSTVDLPILDPQGGRAYGGAAVLSFAMNMTPTPPVWCALVDRTPRDLSANRGLSFWLKADGEYRVWVQIRDRNDASADEGKEAWFASVRTSTAWTLRNVPFASLRSIDPRSDGRFDASRIAHLVFVIDHGAMPFGSRGKVWIDDLMAY